MWCFIPFLAGLDPWLNDPTQVGRAPCRPRSTRKHARTCWREKSFEAQGQLPASCSLAATPCPRQERLVPLRIGKGRSGEPRKPPRDAPVLVLHHRRWHNGARASGGGAGALSRRLTGREAPPAEPSRGIGVWLQCPRLLGLLPAWKKIGYLPEDFASSLAPALDTSEALVATGKGRTIYSPIGRVEAVVSVEVFPRA